MGRETNIVQEVRLRASEHGCIVWRNNTGKLEDKNGRWVQFGLCVGSSDLIGMTPDGRFLAVEVKAQNGKIRPEQTNFINAVNKKGGVAFIVHSADEFTQQIRACLLNRQ